MPMTETKAIIAIVAGCAAIYFGFTVKQFYTAPSGRWPVARRKGRLLFVFGGALFLFVGFKYFFCDIFF
jgi:hypothetical protein